MKNYSEMSDFEINVDVFELLYGGSPDCKKGDDGAMIVLSYEGDVYDGEMVEVEVERGIFNPCNNPSDVWPIMLENKISIMWQTAEKDWCAWANGDLEDGCWDWKYCPDDYYAHASPFRAAMIVFLMMKEAGA